MSVRTSDGESAGPPLSADAAGFVTALVVEVDAGT
jgi:hypothetical protein